ncbi:MAG: hypothetical protein ACREFO_08080 [Acetobacteraceae bacterium]
MTAFLDVDVPQAQAAPLNLHVALRRTDVPRPALIARDGRLICRRCTGSPASFRPPPD